MEQVSRKSFASIPSVRSAEQAGDIAPPPRYPRPKVLLLDTPPSVLASLKDKGFNVVAGTLGKPYVVKKSSHFQQLVGRHVAPNHTEQEIVVVDLTCDCSAGGATGEPERPATEPDLWGKCDRGFLDRRVRSAAQLKQAFDRIHAGGGVFIVFADQATGVKTALAKMDFGTLAIIEDFPANAWDFLSELAGITVKADSGTEMRISSEQPPLTELLKRHLEYSRFHCTLDGQYNKPWQSLAVNKFGNTVAMARVAPSHGWVIVLPQLADKAAFLSELLTSTLPEMAPHLFPDIEEGRWTHQPDYELPKIIELKERQVAIQDRAKLEIEEIDKAIQAERLSHQWMHDLLTGTDSCLVSAVKEALRWLGFAKVVDVDEQRDSEGKTRREDLQIADSKPTLIVDVKGIGGYPSDDDALQAFKHAAIRMREEDRTDIVGLSIINHQRHVPPLDRDNVMPFRKELLDAAETQQLGLMTSWDLYRLVRNFQRHGWRPDDVKPVLYRRARIDPVPEHYQSLGRITKVWTERFGLVMEAGTLSVGDRVSVEFPIEFEEVKVESMMVNDVAVENCAAGDQVGLLWPADKPKLREGLRVFRCATPG